MKKRMFSVIFTAVMVFVFTVAAYGCDFSFGTKKGWVRSHGNVYYYDDDGNEYSGMHVMPDDGTTRYFDEQTHIMVTGEAEIEGNKYLFDGEGIMQTGFCTVDGNTRYYDPDTGIMKTGWYKTGSGTLYFDKNTGDELTGWAEIEGSRYYFSPDDGNLVKGSFGIDDGQYYADPSNGKIATGLTTIEDKQYCFDLDTGRMVKGWTDVDGDKYYFDEESGQGVNGIIDIEGSRHGFIAGKMIRDERAVGDNHLYYFDDEGDIVREIDGNKPMVALTYDDGPSIYTDQILDVYEEYGQRCTFFIVGDRISWNEDQAIREAELGCEQGNHTYGHNRLTDLDADEQIEVLQETDDELIRVSGKPSTCLRPPEGRWNDTLKEVCGCPIILWSVDSRDWESRDADKICSKVIGQVKDGDIVLMHDLYEATAEATERIVPALLDDGFQLVTIEELGILKRGGLEDGVVYYSIE